MVMRFFIRHKLLINRLLVVFFIVLTFSTQRAETQNNSQKVFKNRYVVELFDQSNELTSAAQYNNNSSDIVKSLSKTRKLIRNRFIAEEANISGSQENSLVDFNSNDKFCEKLVSSRQVKACSPDFEIKINATIPNDALYESMWALNGNYGISASDAWDINTGSSEMVVAVVDTGVDYNHPDLAANIWTNSGEIPSNGKDDDSDGYIDNVFGWNSFSSNGDPLDDNGHGTHVAGVIGAVGNNGFGISGINWNVKIMPIKFLNQYGSGSLSSAIEALEFLVVMKQKGVNVRVSNNSWGGGNFSQVLYNAIKKVSDAGIVFVAAAGNESNDNDLNPSYPASYQIPNIISVAALDSNGGIAGFSNYGVRSVGIAAPGVDIVSTYLGGGYTSLSGTSMATPHVSGAIALLFANEPNLSEAEAIQRIYLSGNAIPGIENYIYSGRSLNLGNLLKNIQVPVPPPNTTPSNCSYLVKETEFNPDTAAESADIIIQADEFGYYQLSLPFSFPYYGDLISKLVISPNGVVYTKGSPSGMDYINQTEAPINAIAAMHADLSTQNTPHAVRAKVASDHVSIHWLAESYTLKGKGDVKTWLTIFADGTIDDSISFTSNQIESFFQSRATVGVKGANSNNATTYLYNSTELKNQLSLRYTAVCNNNAPTTAAVDKVTVRGIKKSGKLSKDITPGRGMRIAVTGLGNGTVQLKAAFNNQYCPNVLDLPFNNGLVLDGKLPKVTDEFASFKVKIGSAGKRISITHLQKSKNNLGKQNTKRISRAKIKSYCKKLFATLG
jgi:subtilisin family serine protease